jgi:16S rRNA (cytosine967-C5)-methyltransferase
MVALFGIYYNYVALLCILAHPWTPTTSCFHLVSSSKSRRSVASNYGTARSQADELSTLQEQANQPQHHKPELLSSRSLAVRALVPRSSHGANTAGTFAVDRLESMLTEISHTTRQLALRDRAFARLLVATVERRVGQIDAILEAMQDRTSSNNSSNKRRSRNRTDLYVEAALRIGVAQLLFLNKPAHAAVKETIDVLKNIVDPHIPPPKIKYVNAVLRRISSEGQELMTTVPGADITANAAPWLVEAWKEQWGEANTHQILAAAMVETPRCLTVNVQDIYAKEPIAAVRNEEEQRRIQYIASLFHNAEILSQGSIRVPFPPPGPISTWPLYAKGAWWCQDASASVPALAIYRSLSRGGTLPVHEMRVVDLCSAPGGKTAQLSNFGFGSVTAVEISKKRRVRLQQNMERLNMNWNIVVADGSEWCPAGNDLVDAVLVDVPCTATGTASKRPDVLRRDSDYRQLLRVQQELAQHAANNIVKIGGILVYATCSLLKEESEEQVKTLLQPQQHGAGLETVPFELGEIPGFDNAIDENGWIRVLPGSLSGSLGQCDGFFVARLRRVS